MEKFLAVQYQPARGTAEVLRPNGQIHPNVEVLLIYLLDVPLGEQDLPSLKDTGSPASRAD